jgi:hypothetical protein
MMKRVRYESPSRSLGRRRLSQGERGAAVRCVRTGSFERSEHLTFAELYPGQAGDPFRLAGFFTLKSIAYGKNAATIVSPLETGQAGNHLEGDASSPKASPKLTHENETARFPPTGPFSFAAKDEGGPS